MRFVAVSLNFPLIALALASMLLAGCPRVSPGVDYVRNVVYGQGYVARPRGDGHVLRPLVMDIIAPDTLGRGKGQPGASATALPAAIVVHGGGFEGGTRRDEELIALADALAVAGYACFLIDYRLTKDDPPAPAPYDSDALERAGHAAVVDAKAAMRHVRANAAAYGIDPNRIALLGESAGAITVLGAGLSDPADFTSDGDDFPIPAENHPGTDFKPRAIVDLWGMARPFEAEFDGADPPVFIGHGVLDTTIPVTEAAYIAEQCDAHGIPRELRLFLLEPHGAWNGESGGQSLAELVVAFLAAWVR